MVPDGYAAEDLRVVAHKIFKFQTIGGAPLAFSDLRFKLIT